MKFSDWPGVRRVFRLPSTAARRRADVDAELEFHIEGRVQELVSQGMSPDDAAREARRIFGDYRRVGAELERVDRTLHRKRGLRERAGALSSDLRYTLRTLRRQPLFAGVVVATLTLGIGATSAIFHAVDRVVLHPLPYPHPETIAYLGWGWEKGGTASGLSARKFQFWHDNSRAFDALGAFKLFEAVAGRNAGSTASRNTVIQGRRISREYLHVLGAAPAFGRAFLPEEFVPGAAPVVILGHAFWQSYLGGDQGIIGQTIRLDERPYTVVGVMPESFEVAEQPGWAQFFVPLALTQDQLADGGNNYLVMGRIRAGVTPARLRDDMSRVFQAYREAFPGVVQHDDLGVQIMTYQDLYSGASLVTELWIMLGATAFVLLLACANVANLVLARALGRRRELAVRAALGAGRARIVRQVVLEMLVLGLVAGGLSVVVSLASVRGLVALRHVAFLRDSQLRLDPRVVAYTALVAILASLAVGLVVALAATRFDVAGSLGGGLRSTGRGTHRRGLQSVLVGVEAALAMVLLAGAGLLIASFARVLRVDPGFQRDGVFTATTPRGPVPDTSASDIWRFEREVLEHLRATPGIVSAGAVDALPMRGGWNLPMTIEGRPDATEGAVEWRAASTGYLKTLGIPILAGRDIADSDIPGASPVVIVSESFARDYWPGESPIGKRILLGVYQGKSIGPQFAEPPRTVVGMVPDLRDKSLEQSRMRHTVWIPSGQEPRGLIHVPSFAVRARDAGIAAAALRNAMALTNPRLGTPTIAAMRDVVSTSLAGRRFGMVLMSVFAGLALVLTCIGIYGVASYAVTQRVPEMGIRMALGARPSGVVALVVRQGMRPAAIGLLIGVAISLALSRVLSGMLFGVGPRDPWTLGSVALLLGLIALVATYIPARRASRVDPVTALRVD